MSNRWIVQVQNDDLTWDDVHEGPYVSASVHAYLEAPEPKRWLLNGRIFAFAPIPDQEPETPALPYKEAP